MSKACSFVNPDGEGPSGQTGYGVKRKFDVKTDSLIKPAG